MNANKKKRRSIFENFMTYGLVIIAYLIIQMLINTGHISNQMRGLLVPICVYVILAVSLNLVVGISGELSLGHAGFMCVGAFTGAFFTKFAANMIPNLMVRFVIALFIGALAAGLFGILIGIPVMRLRGDYLAIVTLAFGEIIKNIMNVIYIGVDETGLKFGFEKKANMGLSADGTVLMEGAKGITRISRASTFTIGVILVLITIFIVRNLVNSRTGRAIMAVRDNRIAAECIGLNVTKYRLMAFSISAALAGAAGVLYAHNLASVSSATFDYNLSIMILVYVVLGGIGNIWGSIIAAIVLTMLPEMLRFLNNYRMLIYAIVLIVMMILNASPAAIAARQRFIDKFRTWRNKNKEPKEES